ncbi:hypothetical protein EPO44_13380 [bacterium]|nr:MAG: hypothetical protein EPO44_13380 [bacterium]
MARGKRISIGIDVHKEGWQVTAIPEGEEIFHGRMPGDYAALRKLLDRFTDKQRDISKRFMKGYFEGIKRYLDDEEFSVGVIQKWTRMKSRDEVKEAYGLQAKNMLKIPRTPLEGVKTILEGLEKIPAAKTADPRRFVDMSLIDELEKEGFVANLYKH